MNAPEERVCPRCGSHAGDVEFCQTCGLNLWEQPEIPTREEWGQRSDTPQPEPAAGGPAAAAIAWWSSVSTRAKLFGAGGLAAVAVVAAIVASGGSDGDSTEGVNGVGGGAAGSGASGPSGNLPPPKSPETLAAERAVLKSAKQTYYDQKILAADCEKSGFQPGSSIYTCILTTADLVTAPAEWSVFDTGDGLIATLAR